MWDASGKRENEAFDLLDAALDWCDAAGLKAVVNLHILRSHYFLDESPPLFSDPAEAHRFAGLWQDLSAALRGRSADRVAFELMNEPVATDAADWNRVAKGAWETLRRAEPHRTIVLGSNRWNSVDTFDALLVPEDPHLLLTFHYYHPMLVTHHRAPWCKTICGYAGPIRYPGQPVPEEEIAKLAEPLKGEVQKGNDAFDATVMEQQLAKPMAVSMRTRLPLFCGEFGVLNTVPDDIRLRWYRGFYRRAGQACHCLGELGLPRRVRHRRPEGREPTAVLQGLMG